MRKSTMPPAAARPRRIKHRITRVFSVGNAAAGLAAQVFSSLTTFAVVILTARYLELSVHGHFVFGVALCQIVLSLVRALCGETIVVLSTRGEVSKKMFDATVSAAVLATALGAVACLLTAVAWSEYRSILLATAAVCLPVCVLDVLRYCVISMKRSSLLLGNDATVFILTILSFIVCGRYTNSPVVFLLAWGLACGICAGVLVLRLGIRGVDTRETWSWLRTNFSRSSAFVAEAALGAVAGVSVLAVMALVTDSEQISIFRTALTIMGITALINNFMRSTMLRELSPELLGNRRTLMRVFVLMVATVSLVVIAFGVCIWVAPTWLTVAVFGANFLAILPVLVPTIAHRVAGSCSTIPTIFLRAQGVTWAATRLRIIVVVLGIIIGPLGAYLFGAWGALVGETITYMLLFIGLSVLVWGTARKQGRNR